LADTDSGGIAAYYDNLSRFLDVARRLGRGGGSQHSSTHRFIAGVDGETDAAQALPERLDHLILDAALAAGLPNTPRVLDAGCGLGGTIFRWHARVGGKYDGLTLSPEQVRRATAEAARRDASNDCRFYLHSYQDPIGDSYDAAIAIESLAHSPDPSAAIANLARALAPQGLLLIVDDMPEGDHAPAMLRAFKARWRCPVLADALSFRAAMTAAGLNVISDTDLTPRLRPRALPWLRVLIAAFACAQALSPSRRLRDALDAVIGGFLLEALYRKRAMRYRMVIATKPAGL